MIPLGVLASSYVAPAGGAITVTHLSNWYATGNTSTRTFSGVALGDAQDKTVIVAVSDRVGSGWANGTITVAGYTATIDIRSASHSAAFIGHVSIPSTVTSGDIVVTTGTSGAHVISVYVTYDAVAVVDADQTTATASTLNRTVDTAAGGFAVASFSTSTGTSPTATWNGLTERYEYSTTAGVFTTADGTTDGSSLTVTATATASGLYAALAVVTYGPA